MTDLFTSSLIATATTAATNQLSHEPTEAADPPGMLLWVNVGWTDAEEISKEPPPCRTAETGLGNATVTHHHGDKQEEETTQAAFFAVSALWIEGNLSGLPLCDTKTLPTSIPLQLSVSPPSSISSSLLFILPLVPSCSPRPPRHAATDLCFRERYSVNPCWLKDSFVRC